MGDTYNAGDQLDWASLSSADAKLKVARSDESIDASGQGVLSCSTSIPPTSPHSSITSAPRRAGRGDSRRLTRPEGRDAPARPRRLSRSRRTGTSTCGSTTRTRSRRTPRTSAARSSCRRWTHPAFSTAPARRLLGRESESLEAVSSRPGSCVAIEPRVRVFCRVKLPPSLSHDPAPSPSIDGQDGPALAVLVAEVHEQRVSIVLDPQSVGGVVLLAEDARLVVFTISKEGRPTRARRARQVPRCGHAGGGGLVSRRRAQRGSRRDRRPGRGRSPRPPATPSRALQPRAAPRARDGPRRRWPPGSRSGW